MWLCFAYLHISITAEILLHNSLFHSQACHTATVKSNGYICLPLITMLSVEVLSIKRQISEVLSIKSSIFFRNITVKDLKWFKHFRLMVKLENMDNVTKQGNIYKYDLHTILHYYKYDLHTILQYITSVFYFLFTILFVFKIKTHPS